MGLKNFRKADDYVNIGQIFFDKAGRRLQIRMNYFDAKGGQLLMPIDLTIERGLAIEGYILEKNAAVSEPVYPELCSKREAKAPMWTDDSTDDEKAAYEAAKVKYESEVTVHGVAIQKIKDDAETMNEYDTSFPSALMYGDGNIEQCVYLWVKTLSLFNGVEDDI